MKRYKYITIESDGAGGYGIRNNRGRNIIGHIEKYKPWNQWVLIPFGGTVWSISCHDDVKDFIENEIPKGVKNGRK